MNSAPAEVIAPILAVTILITAARWALLRDTMVDRLLNRALTWNIIGVLANFAAAALGLDNLGPRLFLAFGLFALANFYGLARLFEGGRRQDMIPRLRVYYLVAAACSGTLLFTTSPIGRALSIDQLIDWQTVIWTGSDVFIAISMVRLLRACVGELRTDCTSRERLMYVTVLLTAVFSFVSTLVALARIASGVPPAEPGRAGVLGAFVGMLLFALLVAIPLVGELLARTGFDRAGRTCRQLLPLWRDLTTVVPEVVLPPVDSRADDSAARLYRMTVEIWDALLHLRQYLPENSPPSGESVERFSVRLARAAWAKEVGLRTSGDQGSAAAAPIPVGGRGGELRALLELAHEWPAARAAVVPKPLKDQRLGVCRLGKPIFLR
ncbi:MAB_1171c family putative transporter [Nocardia beijingensis]|uniref:MAB_1171c family putative transporter n=1 Tax=Nocardia beijingensis TaxID=95162 RepID=UPI00332AB355